MIPFHPKTAQTRISPSAATCSLVPEACPERSRRAPVILTTVHCSLRSVFPAHNGPMMFELTIVTQRSSATPESLPKRLPTPGYLLLATGSRLLARGRPISPAFLTTNHYSLTTAFHAFPTTDHCSLTTVFTPPPYPFSPHPPIVSAPHPPCRFVKL